MRRQRNHRHQPDRISLSQLRIASPCDASWEDMHGDERMRHCEQCGLNVYNLSAMSDEEAQALVREHSGRRLCARLYKRADGTVITRDCPRGLAALKARARRGWQRVAASVALLAATSTLLGVVSARTSRANQRLSELEPVSTVKNAINPAPPAPVIPLGRCVMGEIMVQPAVPNGGNGASGG